jgi:hypothetical protein
LEARGAIAKLGGAIAKLGGAIANVGAAARTSLEPSTQFRGLAKNDLQDATLSGSADTTAPNWRPCEPERHGYEDLLQSRALGRIWSEKGDSAEELALFTLKVLDGLVGDLTAARESSRLSQDPASLLTAGLGERPRALGL